jgi:hypothetical protein
LSSLEDDLLGAERVAGLHEPRDHLLLTLRELHTDTAQSGDALHRVVQSFADLNR